MTLRKQLLIVCLLFLWSGLAAPSFGFIYNPQGGVIWDPSVFYHEGKYHVVTMYGLSEEGEHVWGNARFLALASSDDGVHWENQGPIIHRYCKKMNFGKACVRKLADGRFS